MNPNHINNPQFDSYTIRKKPTTPPKKSSGYVQTHESKVEKQIEDGNFKIKKYETSFIQKIISFRSSKSWNQQAFAQQVQLQLPIIKGIESNTIPYNSAYVNKINNFIDKNKK